MAPEKKLGGSLMRRVGAFPAVAGERKVCVGGGASGRADHKASLRRARRFADCVFVCVFALCPFEILS